MKFSKVISEKIEIESNMDSINKNFRKYLYNVFSEVFIKKLDRVFKEPLIVNNFEENSNVMALTVKDKISVNEKMFNSLPLDNAMVYIIHELFHVLQNSNKFKEIKTVNNLLCIKTLAKIPKDKINKFLTGKQQNIHSNYKDEFLSYCANSAFDWSISPILKTEYYEVLNRSGIFNMESDWWKKRFN